MVIPKGHEMSRHQVEGAITIYCLDGRIAFTTGGKTHDLKAGHWLFLLGNEPHSLVGVEDASVLLTIIFPSEGRVSRPRMRKSAKIMAHETFQNCIEGVLDLCLGV